MCKRLTVPSSNFEEASMKDILRSVEKVLYCALIATTPS